MVGVDPHNIHSSKGKKWLVLGMVWQLIKMFLYKEINLTTAPGLIGLLVDGEDIADMDHLATFVYSLCMEYLATQVADAVDELSLNA